MIYTSSDVSHDPMIRKTVGACAVELMNNGDQSQGVIDTQREMMKGYVDELIKCAHKGLIAYPDSKLFYVCVQTRRERLLENVIRNQFYHRLTRPTPQYDLALYHYDVKAEQIRFVWCIPDKQTVEDMSILGFIPSKADEQLHYFVKSFVSGTLI